MHQIRRLAVRLLPTSRAARATAAGSGGPNTPPAALARLAALWSRGSPPLTKHGGSQGLNPKPDFLRAVRFASSSSSRQEDAALQFCIVGSGPAGFYTADKLLKAFEGAHVDILERLYAPFGLVRSGVAPDHPETKLVINQFTALLSAGERCAFLGNVNVGGDVQLPELRQLYSAVILAYGAESDRRLGIPGEELPGVVSAREFVGWYNGHPDYAALPLDLTSTDTAAVLGQGNVALDVARVLLRERAELATTDVAEHAMAALEESTIRRVLLVGRRGPAQAACTAKELRELLGLKGVAVRVRKEDLPLSPADEVELKRSRSHRRVYELFTRAAAAAAAAAPPPGAAPAGREVEFVFFRSPVAICPAAGGAPPRAGGVRVEKTRLSGGSDGTGQRALGTGEFEDLPCGLVLRSIGYKSVAIPGVTLNRQGVVPNALGRVLLASKGGGGDAAAAVAVPTEVPAVPAAHEPGLYVVGWLKRGPTGIIGTNLVDAEETVMSIVEDERRGLLPPASHRPGEQVRELLRARGVPAVTFADWQKLDGEEVRRGAARGKPREKIVRAAEALGLVGGVTARGLAG